MVSVGVDDVRSGRSFSDRLLEWGNSVRITLFLAFLGCLCSFLCPLFFFVGEGQAVGDVGPIRLMMMFLSCVSTAAVYRVGFVLRYHRIMRERLPVAGTVMVSLMCAVGTAIGNSLTYGGTWATVVGLVLLATAVFGLLEMAKPVHDYHLFNFFWCLPIITAIRLYGWDFVYLGWPMLTVVLMVFFTFWNSFFLLITSPA